MDILNFKLSKNGRIIKFSAKDIIKESYLKKFSSLSILGPSMSSYFMYVSSPINKNDIEFVKEFFDDNKSNKKVFNYLSKNLDKLNDKLIDLHKQYMEKIYPTFIHLEYGYNQDKLIIQSKKCINKIKYIYVQPSEYNIDENILLLTPKIYKHPLVSNKESILTLFGGELLRKLFISYEKELHYLTKIKNIFSEFYEIYDYSIEEKNIILNELVSNLVKYNKISFKSAYIIKEEIEKNWILI